MLCVQVDLVVRTIQPKADGALSLTAIDVIDEQSLDLLGHVCSVSLVELCTRLDDEPSKSTPCADIENACPSQEYERGQLGRNIVTIGMRLHTTSRTPCLVY